jgi:hypothetical protein
MFGYSAQEIVSSLGDSIKHIFQLDPKKAVIAHPGNGQEGKDEPNVWMIAAIVLFIIVLIKR